MVRVAVVVDGGFVVVVVVIVAFAVAVSTTFSCVVSSLTTFAIAVVALNLTYCATPDETDEQGLDMLARAFCGHIHLE